MLVDEVYEGDDIMRMSSAFVSVVKVYKIFSMEEIKTVEAITNARIPESPNDLSK